MSVKVYAAIARKGFMQPTDDVELDIFDARPTQEQLVPLCLKVKGASGDMVVHCRELSLLGQVERAFIAGNDAHTQALQSMFTYKIRECLDALIDEFGEGLRARPDAKTGLELAIVIVDALKKSLDDFRIPVS